MQGRQQAAEAAEKGSEAAKSTGSSHFGSSQFESEPLFFFGVADNPYATENCDRLPVAVLQKKMRHKDIQTTMRYVETARKMKKAAEKVYVPGFLSRKAN